jgi:hypothetical protein
MYARISSAHKMLDYRNFAALADHLVWVPFHFLPGNGGLPAGRDPDGPFVRKLVCVPDSPVARDMVDAAIAQRSKRHGLHRLGIAMHVYADTWAHQGFAGVSHAINHARHLTTGPEAQPDVSKMNRLKRYFLNEALPLGHGAVLGNPDRPYLLWGYTNGHGERIVRDNPRDFVLAANRMCQAMQRYRAGGVGQDPPGLSARDLRVVERLLGDTTHEEGRDRHAVWIDAIADGAFSFGAERIGYIGEGEGSWKHLALGALAPPEGGYRFRPEFLRSDWKLFHDALQAHRLDLVTSILPEYGICVA